MVRVQDGAVRRKSLLRKPNVGSGGRGRHDNGVYDTGQTVANEYTYDEMEDARLDKGRLVN